MNARQGEVATAAALTTFSTSGTVYDKSARRALASFRSSVVKPSVNLS
jgi:hypothetical protein